MTDITYIRTGERWLHLCVVVDLTPRLYALPVMLQDVAWDRILGALVGEPGALIVLNACLPAIAAEGQRALLSLGQVARRLGTSVRTVERHMATLRDMEFLESQARPGFESRYWLGPALEGPAPAGARIADGGAVAESPHPAHGIHPGPASEPAGPGMDLARGSVVRVEPTEDGVCFHLKGGARLKVGPGGTRLIPRGS